MTGFSHLSVVRHLLKKLLFAYKLHEFIIINIIITEKIDCKVHGLTKNLGSIVTVQFYNSNTVVFY